MRPIHLLSTILLLLLVACSPAVEAPPILVTLVVDGRQQLYSNTEPITVGQFLRSDEVEVELGSLDRVNPPLVTQISDGMTITVVRVTEDEECEEAPIPYEITTRRFEGLPPGEESLQQAGQNGTEQICYRITYTDGTLDERIEISRTVLAPPVDEIIFIGVDDTLEPVSVNGTLAYINNQNAWVIRGSSTTKSQITFTGDLDGRVFSLDDSGRRLLISRGTTDNAEADSSGTFNQLFLINDVRQASPELVPLSIQNVLFAAWRPAYENTFAYSGAEPSETGGGWLAYNDLWLATVNPANGDIIDIEPVIDENGGGSYGWWGTTYQWSPDGERMAYVRADGVGLVDLVRGELTPYVLDYDLLNPLGQDWSWRTTVSWTPDSTSLVATVHGPPIGNEDPETSPVFDIGVAAADGSFVVSELVERVGIWSTPRFSPEVVATSTPFPVSYLAYLRAREWQDSITSEYDLIVADRDGSNARVLFPEPGQPGLTAADFATEFTWSPDGREIAFIYRGNLWKINVETGLANQLTVDGGASRPVWMP